MVKNSKKIKQSKVESEDVLKIRNLVILLISVIVICIGVFFLTERMIENENQDLETTKEVDIDYDIATIGTMFNRPESEYYVLIYSNLNDGENLDSVLDTYRSSDNYIKTYYIDLDMKMNSIAKGEVLVENPKTSNEVSVTGPTLYKFKDGKVIDCYSGGDNIIDILK